MTNLQTAIFGGGCFWCTEAVFKMLKGVTSVTPGYAGGDQRPTTNPEKLRVGASDSRQNSRPTYEEVCSGKTGHAEVVRIEFDPAQIAFRDLMTVFFGTHNPTTPNQQGADMGTQYRSTILYTTDDQKREAEAFIKELNDSNTKGAPVITEVKPLTQFFEAEDYHKDYYAKNPGNPYCEVVINPKLEKVQKEFAKLLAP